MTKLGELLKAEREKKGLSLHEIGMNLKINPKILKAIEDGNPKDLPAKTFLRGFIKSYAQHMRLDQKEMMDLFQEEYGTTRPEEPQKVPGSSTNSAPQTTVSAPKYEKPLKRPDDAALPTNNNNRIYTILFAILLLTLIAFVAKMMDKYQKESRLATTEVVETIAETTTTSTTVPATPEAEVALATPISSSAAATAVVDASATTSSSTTSSTSTSTSTTVKPAMTTTTLKAVIPVTTSSTTTTTTPSLSTSTSTSTSVTTSTTIKSANTEVIVEALNKVRIRFTLNAGQRWDQIELSPDQVHTFRTKTAMELEISDGGAVNLIVNGRDRGVPGTIGRPLKLAYPK